MWNVMLDVYVSSALIRTRTVGMVKNVAKKGVILFLVIVRIIIPF